MHVVASFLFRVIHFPHQGKIFTIDQLSLFSSSSTDGNVLYLKHSGAPYESVGASLFKASILMGIFPLPPPHFDSVKFDPWVVPSPDLVDTWGEVLPLSPAKINYVEIVSASPSVSSDFSVS